MNIDRKKVLLIPLEGVLTEGGGVTEILLRRELLDRIRRMNISHVAIITGESDDKDYQVKVKTVEYFVFVYCKTAVSTHQVGERLFDEIAGRLPHNQRKKEVFLSVGCRIDGVDGLSLEDFLR